MAKYLMLFVLFFVNGAYAQNANLTIHNLNGEVVQADEVTVEVKLYIDSLRTAYRVGYYKGSTLIRYNLVYLPGDGDADDDVDFSDFLSFTNSFNGNQNDPSDTRYRPLYDFNSDGIIGFADFLIFVKFFGRNIDDLSDTRYDFSLKGGFATFADVATSITGLQSARNATVEVNEHPHTVDLSPPSTITVGYGDTTHVNVGEYIITDDELSFSITNADSFNHRFLGSQLFISTDKLMSSDTQVTVIGTDGAGQEVRLGFTVLQSNASFALVTTMADTGYINSIVAYATYVQVLWNGFPSSVPLRRVAPDSISGMTRLLDTVGTPEIPGVYPITFYYQGLSVVDTLVVVTPPDTTGVLVSTFEIEGIGSLIDTSGSIKDTIKANGNDIIISNMAFDEKPVELSITIGGNNVWNTPFKSIAPLKIDASLIPEGNSDLVIETVDNNGNRSVIRIPVSRPDTSGPTVDTADVSVSGRDLAVTYAVSDPMSGIGKVEVLVDGSVEYEQTFIDSSSASGTFSFQLPENTSSISVDRTIVLRVTDTQGNQTETSYTVTQDPTPQEINTSGGGDSGGGDSGGGSTPVTPTPTDPDPASSNETVNGQGPGSFVVGASFSVSATVTGTAVWKDQNGTVRLNGASGTIAGFNGTLTLEVTSNNQTISRGPWNVASPGAP